MTVILKLVFFQNPFLVSFCHRYKSYLCNVIITKLMTIKNTHEAAREFLTDLLAGKRNIEFLQNMKTFFMMAI
jgi:hypothetical protein